MSKSYGAPWAMAIFLLANGSSAVEAPTGGFVLLDKVCALVEGEEPILLSHINNRMRQQDISFARARKSLIYDKLLWVLARKQYKYNVADIKKAAREHSEKIRKTNNLSILQYADLLMSPPYSTTISQFEVETATSILENNMLSALAGQVSISEQRIKEEVDRHKSLEEGKENVVLISIAAPRQSGSAAKEKQSLRAISAQFTKANEIKTKIKRSSAPDDIKTKLEGDEAASMIGPIPYQPGTLKKFYEDKLRAEPDSAVIGPFKDDDAVTLIWRWKARLSEEDESALLEKVRKTLYDIAVKEKLNAERRALWSDSTVMIKNCGRP